MSKDYYSLLGVNKESSSEEIKKSYRTLSKKYHPDISKEEDAEEKFKAINEAYSVLSDEKKKSNYDRFGSEKGPGGYGGGQDQGFGGSPDFNFEDIFSGFGDIFGHGRKRKRRGEDINVRMNITLDEIEIGGEKTIRYQRKVACGACDGHGGDHKTCMGCNGSGHTMNTTRTPMGIIQQQIVCSNCGGSGEIITNKCNVCDGKSMSVETEEILFDIPVGISHGIAYKYPSKGHENSNGAGDLIIEFITEKHHRFHRQDNNLIYQLNLPFNILTLGGKVNIQGLNNATYEVDIPEMTQPGYNLRIKGKGLPLMDNPSIKGDILLNIQLEFPNKISEDEKDIISKLNNSNNFIYKSK